MGPEAWVAAIAGAALVLDLIVHLIGGTMILSRSRESLAKQLSEQLDKRADYLSDQITRHRQGVDVEFNTFRGEIGETFKAIRQAISDVSDKANRVELEAYKTFLRRDSMDSITTRLDKLDVKIDQSSKDHTQRMKEVEDKLDQAIRDINRP